MISLLKKAFVLLVLFLLVLAVYLVKNPDIKDGLLAKINIFKPNNLDNLEMPKDTKIGEEDINMEKLIFEGSDENLTEEAKTKEEIEESGYSIIPETESEKFHEEQEGGNFLTAAAQNNRQASLEDIKNQIAEISEQIQKIRKEIDILIAINEIQKEINELAEKAESLDNECEECSILSSI